MYATYDFEQNLIDIYERDAKLIGELKHKAADEQVKLAKTFYPKLDVDKDYYDSLFTFKGFTAGYKTSECKRTAAFILLSDRASHIQKPIKYFDNYLVTATADKPVAYVIPQARGKEIELFKLNNVAMKRLSHDTTLDLHKYYIGDYKTPQRPFEGHYLHSNVMFNPVDMKCKILRG